MSQDNYITVSLEAAAPVAVATIRRVDNDRNQIDVGMLDALQACFASLREDTSLRGLVLISAREKVFSTGADIAGPLGDGSAGDALKFSHRGSAVFGQLTSLPFVTVVALSGFVLGGGLELALCADFRIAARNCRLGLPEINLGLLPGWGGTQRLQRLVGRSRAMRAILTGDPLNAEAALACGLVDEVAETYADLLPAAMKLLAPIIQKSRRSVAAIKHAMYAGGEMPLGAGLELESSLFSRAWDTPDRIEGIAALREKRKPRWPE